MRQKWQFIFKPEETVYTFTKLQYLIYNCNYYNSTFGNTILWVYIYLKHNFIRNSRLGDPVLSTAHTTFSFLFQFLSCIILSCIAFLLSIQGKEFKKCKKNKKSGNKTEKTPPRYYLTAKLCWYWGFCLRGRSNHKKQ